MKIHAQKLRRWPTPAIPFAAAAPLLHSVQAAGPDSKNIYVLNYRMGGRTATAAPAERKAVSRGSAAIRRVTRRGQIISAKGRMFDAAGRTRSGHAIY